MEVEPKHGYRGVVSILEAFYFFLILTVRHLDDVCAW